MYIPNDDTQNERFYRLQLVVKLKRNQPIKFYKKSLKWLIQRIRKWCYKTPCAGCVIIMLRNFIKSDLGPRNNAGVTNVGVDI